MPHLGDDRSLGCGAPVGQAHQLGTVAVVVAEGPAAPLAALVREVREEAGIDVEIVGLVGRLTATTTVWAEVMAQVARERFIPDRIWRHEPGREGNDLVPVDRSSDPDTWTAIVAGDEPVDTQVDNGQPAPDGTCGGHRR